MNLYRFCSSEELDTLLRKGCVRNHTDHYRGGRGGSVSRGFCLTEDEPHTAWKYLKGIVSPDYCCRYEIPDEQLRFSAGKYFGGFDDKGKPHSCMKREWCTDVLRRKWLKEAIPCRDFISGYEIEAARKVLCMKLLGII